MTSSGHIQLEPMNPFRAALFIAHSQFMGAPHSIDLDDFMFGERRAIWIELENIARAEEGKPALDNDEEDRPELAKVRREGLIEGFIDEARAKGIREDEYGRQDAVRDVDCLEVQLISAFEHFEGSRSETVIALHRSRPCRKSS